MQTPSVRWRSSPRPWSCGPAGGCWTWDAVPGGTPAPLPIEERDAEHAAALAEMIGTVKAGGWFVIDFLNPEAVRERLVPRQTIEVSGEQIEVTRSVSPDGRYVCKSIQVPKGKRYFERVRLFTPGQISEMVEDTGLSVRHAFGNYDASPLTPASPRTIVMGQAR
jgi:hypothetical protein